MEGTVIEFGQLFDLLLAVLILWLAWRAMTSQSLFQAIVLFVAFGLSMALAWARLDALDVALAEIAVSAGLTGALLLAAFRGVRRSGEQSSRGEHSSRDQPYRVIIAGISILILAGLTLAILTLPPVAGGLADAVDARLAATHIGNPVTATLLYFRGYDTLLELAVLLLALMAIRAIRRGDSSLQRPGGEILAVLVGLQAPTMILIAGYLLWSGADAPGGAFQAGAVLAAAGVLLILAGVRLPRLSESLSLRVGLAAGLAVFLGLGIVSILAGGAFLDYSRLGGGVITLILEGSATLSIGLLLLEMFRSVLGGSRSRGTNSRAKGKRR